jgi:hypothetical protein
MEFRNMESFAFPVASMRKPSPSEGRAGMISIPACELWAIVAEPASRS